MPFALLPPGPTDIPTAVSLYFAAFQNAHSLACWPRTPPIRAWWENMFRDELADPGAHWLKAVSTTTGDLAGFAKWVEPKVEGEMPSLELPEWPREADGRLCEETFGAWARERRRVMGGRRHWYLEMVAVSPKYQGQGAGSQILRWGTEKADQQGVEAYLDASPDAVKLYERHGFREVGKLDTWIENDRVVGEWYRNLFMVREPQTRED